ncbi:MAG: response regulator transcription factor [Deltaproteobacteria bacterium]|nr:response regulator transcription factor [Deltaproteobacteria bacterium]MBW2594551.1 response regulator transcription factor [Deltaproteobacteria bacterium]MBW2649617.1 response regulator transcription factor [Deltaproteobacteria bacterium]
MDPYSIILADDHKMFRLGVRKILEELDDVKVIGEVSDGLALLRMLKEMTPHMVILDISMPNIRGIEATREIKMSDPGIKILILTMHKGREYLHHSISAGAEGYLLKEDADTELYMAIEKIRGGGIFISPILTDDLADNFVQMCRGKYNHDFEILTSREREIIKFVAEGKTNKKIAGMLYISIRTVENHRANMMKKLNLKNTSELVKYAISKDYIAISD